MWTVDGIINPELEHKQSSLVPLMPLDAIKYSQAAASDVNTSLCLKCFEQLCNFGIW